MHHRLIAILALLCFAFGGGGCELFEPSKKPKKPSRKKKQYKEVLMPMQTGSNLQRRTYIEMGPDNEKAKKPKKKPSPTPKPEAEPAATPSPTEEESPAPTPERFR